jgi:predicted dehydrogenase
MDKKITRRGFIQQIVGAGLAMPMLPPRLSFAQPPNSKLQHAAIGVGGMMGGEDLQSILNTGKVDVVAICDIDENYLHQAAEKVPHARKYRDWRKLLEKEEKNIDSVNVTTPDHMHAAIALSAIQKGKHVYCQKPLTHEVYETRQLTLAARQAGVVTQMGIQIHSHVAYRMAVQMIRQGAIGKVKRWHSWQSSSPWSQQGRPQGSDAVPPHIAWDLWIGVAPFRPYKADTYHPRKWRGWQDFGAGVLGDFACHIFDPIFSALDPGELISIHAEAAANNHENWPKWQIVDYEFAGSKFTAGNTVVGTWYDGGKLPPRELVPLAKQRNLPGAGSLVIGEEGTILLPHWAEPELLPAEKFKNYPRPRLEEVDHYGQWVNACLGHGKTSAGFDYSGPLAEAVLLGNVAVRIPGKKLRWDAANMKITNVPEANQYIRRQYRRGWHIKGLS